MNIVMIEMLDGSKNIRPPLDELDEEESKKTEELDHDFSAGLSTELWFQMEKETLLPETLNRSATLKKLNFNRVSKISNTFGVKRAQLCTTLFQYAHSLTTLLLQINDITAEEVKILFEGLKNNASLSHLDLSRNKLGYKGAEFVATFLKNNASLKSLILSENDITCRGAVALSKALVVNTTLTKLDIGRNAIQITGAMSIAEMLKINFSLKKLCYTKEDWRDADARNQFRSEEATLFATALKHNRGLTCVRLLIQDSLFVTGFNTLATSVAQNTAIRHVSFSLSNIYSPHFSGISFVRETLSYVRGIGNNAAITLTNTLRDGGRLTTLRLNDCCIGDSGAEKIAQTLPTNHSLTRLDLSKNYITAKGVSALLKALQKNYTLKSLLLDNNRSHLNRTTALGYLSRNKTLTQCHIDTNPSEYTDTFPEIMDQNTQFCKKTSTLNWGRASILIAFVRANKEHALKYSILPLAREIMQHLPEHENQYLVATKVKP